MIVWENGFLVISTLLPTFMCLTTVFSEDIIYGICTEKEIERGLVFFISLVSQKGKDPLKPKKWIIIFLPKDAQ
jgi:hypothetical protein